MGIEISQHTVDGIIIFCMFFILPSLLPVYEKFFGKKITAVLFGLLCIVLCASLFSWLITSVFRMFA